MNSAATPFNPQPQMHSTHISPETPVLCKVVPLRVEGVNGKFVDTFAFLDDGSGLSMMDRSLYDELGFQGKPQGLHLRWSRGMTRYEDAMLTDVGIEAKTHKRYQLRNVYAVPDL